MKTTINLKTSPKAIKLIAMDLDGTLLDQKENIPVKSIEYLLYLQKKVFALLYDTILKSRQYK